MVFEVLPCASDRGPIVMSLLAAILKVASAGNEVVGFFAREWDVQRDHRVVAGAAA